ncbi:hypothetical protein NL676_013332 [Syzygium grande]|nr:hypothetical protein NL676_013332 [Syzygium grande]
MNALAIVRLLAASAYGFQKGKTRAMSFGGGGTRPGFTDSLYKSHVFKDDSGLLVGEQIGPEVLQYAQSKRCLGKLDKMVVDLGCQRGNFEEAPREHEMQCRREEARERVGALWSRIRGWMSQVIPNGGRGRKESNYMPNSSVARHERQAADILAARVLSESSDQGKKRREYQVFLTFGGFDARYNLAGSLYISLLAEGIKVLTNDDLIGSYEQCERAIRELGSSEGWVSEKIAYGVLVNQVVKEVARLLNIH